MILASLARYYRRLAAKTDEMGNPKVPPYGFSEEKIGWILVLDKEVWGTVSFCTRNK